MISYFIVKAFRLKTPNLPLLLLIIVSLALRLYNISEYAEFLGDQGRDGITIYNLWASKTIPLVGPPVSTGQFPGPFYYYLIAPSLILSHFNPIAPTMFITILEALTVIPLFILGKKLFGPWIGFTLGFMYAVSPQVISVSRIFWNPTAIPLFVTILLLGFYMIKQKKKVQWFAVIGLSTGALSQLHYSNLFYTVVLIAFWAYLLLSKQKATANKGRFFLWSLIGMLSFILVFAPFIIYEINHQFADITAILLSSRVAGESGTFTFARMHDIMYRLAQFIMPISGSFLITVLMVASIIIPLFKKTFWHVFYSVVFVAGIAGISLLQGDLPNHYIVFLLPVAFLLFGSLLSTLSCVISERIICVIVMGTAVTVLAASNVYAIKYNDISRSEQMVKTMIKQSRELPFSFALISSRSFSDLHYRFFFLGEEKQPEHYETGTYELLYLVCDGKPCPSEAEVLESGLLQTKCFDPVCNREYPRIRLDSWRFVERTDIENGRLYKFESL